MSQGADSEVPSTGSPEFARIVSENRAWLAERGAVVVGSGGFRAGPFTGSIHCDFGPPEQDKRINQDYALAWRPHAAEQNGSELLIDENSSDPFIVLALADGLTNSFRSECAAAMACWIAVRAMIEAVDAASPKERALFAFNEVGQALGRLADELVRDPEASCPEGQFVSTWKYILKKGGLFQTTLTLAWLDEDRFYVAMVGDGGALWRGYNGRRGAERADDRVLAACDLESQQVHALGPAERSVRDFDCWCDESAGGSFVCALFTDGVGRGIGARPFMLLDELENLRASGEENAARCFIERAIREWPKAFDDNVTLAVVRR